VATADIAVLLEPMLFQLHLEIRHWRVNGNATNKFSFYDIEHIMQLADIYLFLLSFQSVSLTFHLHLKMYPSITVNALCGY